jgi:hypothetical protein
MHLEGAQQCSGMWQHIHNSIDTQINRLMDNLYQKLNKKLDTLTKQTQTKHNNEKNAFTFHSRLINLTNTEFTKEQIHTITLGPSYAVEKEPKLHINKIIIDTENAIRRLDPKIQNTF